MASIRRRSVEAVASDLYDLVPAAALPDLRSEDPGVAVEVHFEPVVVRPLPAVNFRGADCSIDGYYEATLDPDRPSILYSNEVAAERARFTILHELGHHLLNGDGAHLLDDLDLLGGSAVGAARLEEEVCHQLAGRLLIPSGDLDAVIAGDVLRPAHIVELHDRTNASWEAVAVRAVGHGGIKAAVVLIREPGLVSFAAASGLSWWPRGSPLAPGGPLDKAFVYNSLATPDVHRHGLAYSERMFCGTSRVHDRLVVGVLTPKPRDGHFEILEQPDPVWKEREEFCRWCGNERNVGWCDACSGQRCHSCSRCGCGAPRQNPLCPECLRMNAFNPTARVCVDCEADGLS